MLIVLLMLVVLIHWQITGEYLANDNDGSAERFKSVSTEVHHVCGVQMNGAVTCWGGSNDGQATPPGGAFTLVSAGLMHTCGVRVEDGSVDCWGSNEQGQSSPPNGAFTSVSAGWVHTCAVRVDGQSNAGVPTKI